MFYDTHVHTHLTIPPNSFLSLNLHIPVGSSLKSVAWLPLPWTRRRPLATRGIAHSTWTKILTHSTQMFHSRNFVWLTSHLLRMPHIQNFCPLTSHFLTQACKNQASSTTPIFLSFILHPTPLLTWSLTGACPPSLFRILIKTTHPSFRIHTTHTHPSCYS